MYVLVSRLFLDRGRASKIYFRGERMHVYGGIVLDASSGVWWMGSTALVNGDGFFHWLRGGNRGVGPYISVVMAAFYLGVAA